MAACWRTHCARSPGGSCLLQSMADWLAAAIGGRARRLAAAARASRSDRREGPPAGRSSDLQENHSVLACVDHGGWPTGSNFKLFACVRVDQEWEGWVAHACTAGWFFILKMRGIMDFLLVFLISPKLVGTTYKTEQREYIYHAKWWGNKERKKTRAGIKYIRTFSINTVVSLHRKHNSSIVSSHHTR